MTHPMPDQPPTATKRMTTAEVAALAQETDGRLDDLSAVVTDLATRLQDLGAGDQNTAAALRVAEGVDNTVAELAEKLAQAPTRDQVDSRIHEALQPLHDEVHELRGKGTLTPESQSSLAGVLARLEDAERKVAGVDANGLVATVAQQLHPTLSELRRRLDAVEQVAKAQEADPVSHTLAEDWQTDQLTAMVDRRLAEMFAEAQLTPARLAGLTREFDDLRQHVETHGTHVTRALTSQVAAELRRNPGDGDADHSGPTGAARKVLELMRQVTHIGKEKEANLGKGGRFKFRGVDDAMDAVGHAMRDVGLILGTKILDRETTLTPVTQQGTDNGQAWERTVVWATSVVTARYTFTDPDDGSTHEFEMVGEGRDSSGKSTSKATSMALKYGLFQALMIPVNGLDDADDAPPQQMVDQRSASTTAASQQATPDQRPQRTEEQVATRATEALAAIRNVHRVPGGPPVQRQQLQKIMQQVKAEGLLGYAVEGSTLDQHGHATMATLQAPPPAQESQADPYDHRASYEPPSNEEGF